MQAGYHWIDAALKIAKEHAPNRVKEIAERGFRSYKPGFSPEAYVECAEILGKLEEAKKTLKREARRLKPKQSPRFYEDLVKSLVRLGLLEEAKAVVAKVAEHEREVSEKKRIL
jgi:hypothetical protein